MSEDQENRLDLLEALLRIRLGRATNSSGRVSVKAVADEAGHGRHLLTQRHRDIEELIKQVGHDHRIAIGKLTDPNLAALRAELARERERNNALAGQIAILLASHDLASGPDKFNLRSV